RTNQRYLRPSEREEPDAVFLVVTRGKDVPSPAARLGRPLSRRWKASNVRVDLSQQVHSPAARKVDGRAGEACRNAGAGVRHGAQDSALLDQIFEPPFRHGEARKDGARP